MAENTREQSEERVYVNADDWAAVGASAPQCADIAANAYAVFNAPRPIPGKAVWRGEFRHGVFWAAGSPEDYSADWHDLDAWPAELIDNARVEAEIRRRAVEHGIPWESIDQYGSLAELAQSFGLPWRKAEAA